MTTVGNRRVFISSSSDVDTTAISQLLTSSGYEVTRPSDLPPGDVAAGLRSLVEGSDAVVAVVGADVPDATLVEIGVAIGSRRRVVIVVEGHAEATALPLMLRGLPTIVLGGANLDATAIRLVSALELPLASGSDSPSAAPRVPVTADSARDWADQTERAVAEVLKAKGYRVVAQPGANKVGHVDLAVWISDLGDPVLNPVLVEVTGRRPKTADKVKQLGRYLQESGLLLGMVVTPDNAEPKLQVEVPRAIVVVGAGWLQAADTRDIVAVLTDARNALFHAAP